MPERRAARTTLLRSLSLCSGLTLGGCESGTVLTLSEIDEVRITVRQDQRRPFELEVEYIGRESATECPLIAGLHASIGGVEATRRFEGEVWDQTRAYSLFSSRSCSMDSFWWSDAVDAAADTGELLLWDDTFEFRASVPQPLTPLEVVLPTGSTPAGGTMTLTRSCEEDQLLDAQFYLYPDEDQYYEDVVPLEFSDGSGEIELSIPDHVGPGDWWLALSLESSPPVEPDAGLEVRWSRQLTGDPGGAVSISE